MRLVIQRVSQANVSIAEHVVGQIETGLLILIGICHTDEVTQARLLANKVANLRIFSDDTGKLNRSILDSGGSILVISQFTLYADTAKGNRPSFINAAGAEHANPLYESFMNELRLLGINVIAGVFGADMQVSLINDGPVTIILEK